LFSGLQDRGDKVGIQVLSKQWPPRKFLLYQKQKLAKEQGGKLGNVPGALEDLGAFKQLARF
jgi:hypothetical protein